MREEAYISTMESSSLPAVKTASVPAAVDFVELRLSEQSTAPSIAFKPDIIIRKASFSIEISDTASAELIRRIGSLLHAE